jgi:hypothetical protein
MDSAYADADNARDQLQEDAAKRGLLLAVERVNGHWRAGFVVRNGVGEHVFVLHAIGPDEDTAIRRLSMLAAGGQ